MVLRNLIILSEAEQDVAQAYTWYEEQEVGLGEEFLKKTTSILSLSYH